MGDGLGVTPTRKRFWHYRTLPMRYIEPDMEDAGEEIPSRGFL